MNREPTDEQFEAYRSLFSELRQTHPQRCELARREFDRAVEDEATVCGDVELDGIEVAVPQLVRVDVIDWLNADFFQRTYPEAHASGTLFHLTLWPDIDVPSDVLIALKDLAVRGGTLVLDGPSTGTWSVRTALDRLTGALGNGVISDQVLLGTQTYWAGPLDNPYIDASENPRSLSEAAHAIGRDAATARRSSGSYLRLDLTEQEANSMFDLYAAAYEVLGDHPCAQGVTPEEFRHMMLHEPEMTKLVFQRDGEVESICLITPQLDSLDWINTEFYQARFGDQFDSGRLHWYPAIATDPTSTGARNARSLVELIGELYEAALNPATILFDTPDVNSAFLPPYLEELINGLPHYEVRFEVIAEHEYHAVQLGA